MSVQRSRLHPAILPRGLSRLRAAAYVGLPPEQFDDLVLRNKLPRPYDIDGHQIWDRILLATGRRVNDDALTMPILEDITERRFDRRGALLEWSQFDGPGVYIIGFDRYAKIGVSRAVGKRLRAIDDGLPVTLLVYSIIHRGTPADERILHRRFEHLRHKGEWFDLAGTLLEFVSLIGRPKPPSKTTEYEVIRALDLVRRPHA